LFIANTAQNSIMRKADGDVTLNLPHLLTEVLLQQAYLL